MFTNIIFEVPKEHTAVAIRQVLPSMFEEWDISSKVFRATTDNGQNIVNAIELLSLEHFLPWPILSSWPLRKSIATIPKVHTAIARCKK